jgi:hypothetical protein
MKRTSLVDAFVAFSSWLNLKLIQKGYILKPLADLFSRPKSSKPSHFTLGKVALGLGGFVPVGYFSYKTGEFFSDTVDAREFYSDFVSEDEIFSRLDHGRPVLTMMYLPGEVFSETTHQHFHRAAKEFYQ